MGPHSIVIGGTRGAGHVTAEQLASRGDTVTALGRRAPAGPLSSANITYHTLDILDRAALDDVLQTAIQTCGPVTNLLFFQRHRGDGDDWTGEIETTLTATRTIVELLADRFTEGGGSVVFASSVFADHVGDGQPASYHVAKAGLVQLMRYYAVNLGPRGIRVNSVSPFTYLKNESKQVYLENEELLALYREIVPLGRMGTAEDVAKLAQFLCSADASFITGQNIVVDGGLSLRWPESLARRLRNL